MADFNCGYCGTLNKLSQSKFNARMEYSKSGILYCNPKCNGAGKKLLKLVNSLPMYDEYGVPITVMSKEVLALEFPDLFRGVLASPEKYVGGLSKSNVEGVSTMVSPVQTLAEYMATHPTIMTSPIQELEDGNVLIVLAEASATASPAPVAPPVPPPSTPPVPAPRTPAVANNPVIVPPAGAVTAVSSPVRPRRWQDELSRTTAMGDCDAAMYQDAAGNNVGKACQYHAEAVGGARYAWCFVDQNSGVITFSANQCNRCQGKGWVSEQNLGYNYDFDIRSGKTQVTWEQYKAGFEAASTRNHQVFGNVVPPTIAPAPVQAQQQPVVAEYDNPFASN